MRTLMPYGELDGQRHPAEEGQALELKDLQNQLRLLATLPADPQSPFLSLYLSVEHDAWSAALDERARALRGAYKGAARADLEQALGQARAWLSHGLRPGTRGVALFSRAGRWPHLQGLQFAVPLADQVAAGELPVLGPLVELKDDYDRYVVLVALKDAVRILEVDLGAVTRELWARHPHLRERAGEIWGRRHWREQTERRDPERFWDEKIKLLDRLMQYSGHNHLILAGDPEAVRKLRARLPKHLQAKVSDLLAAQPHDRVDDVVQQTLASFLEREEQESRDLAGVLAAELKRDGLAAAGLAPSLKALRLGAVQTLLLLKSWRAPEGWACRHCPELGLGAAPAACPVCAGGLRRCDLREEAIRLAQASGAHVEVVGLSEALADLGGIGCLLRFKPGPGQAEAPATPAPASAPAPALPRKRRHFAAA